MIPAPNFARNGGGFEEQARQDHRDDLVDKKVRAERRAREKAEREAAEAEAKRITDEKFARYFQCYIQSDKIALLKDQCRIN